MIYEPIRKDRERVINYLDTSVLTDTCYYETTEHEFVTLRDMGSHYSLTLHVETFRKKSIKRRLLIE